MKHIFLILPIFFLNCKPKSTILPLTIPMDLEIYYSESGGMFPIQYTIFISADSCFFKKSGLDFSYGFNFKLSDQELKDMYNVFRSVEFDLINDSCELIYDVGGDYLTLKWDSIIISKHSNGFMVDPESGRLLDSCQTAIFKMVADIKSQYAKKIEVQLDSGTLSRLNTIQVDNKEIWLESNERKQILVTKYIYCFPGDHIINADLYSNANTYSMQFNSDSINNIKVMYLDSNLIFQTNTNLIKEQAK